MAKGKWIVGGAAALLLGTTGFLAACDEGGMDEPDISPPATENQGDFGDGGEPLGTPPAEDNAGAQDDDASDLPALPEPDEGNDGGADF